MNWQLVLFVDEVGYGKLALLYTATGSITFGEGNLVRYIKTLTCVCFLTEQCLGIYSKKIILHSCKNVCTVVLIEVLILIVKWCKQL